MPEARDELFNLKLSEREREHLRILANDLGIPSSVLMRMWIRDAWAKREARMADMAVSAGNGMLAQELNAENA